MGNDFQLVLLTNMLGALVTHEWLKRYDPPALGVALSALATIPAVPLYFVFGGSSDHSSLIISAAWSYTFFYATLLFFVVRYRLSSSHPLSQYPGPTIMKMTKLWGAWIAYKGNTHTYLKELHDRYGPTIRIGPNELSTVEKALIPLILGNQGMPKGPLWDGRRFGQTKDGKGYDSLIDLRDSVLHAQLRKQWNKAFSAEPLHHYEGLLIARVRQLNSHLEDLCLSGSNATGRVDIVKWLNSFSFDLLGDIAFGGCFQLMREADRNRHFACMTDGLYLGSITQHLPWIAQVVHSLPIINNSMKKFTAFGIEHAIKRSTMEVKRKDLFSYMSEASESGSTEPDLPMIISNVLLAIVAGSDTTSSTISNAIYLLLSHPETYKRLKEEVKKVFEINEILHPDEDIPSDSPDTGARYKEVLAGMGYLNAVINETLRLFPVVPTGLQRAPAKGSIGRLIKADAISMFLPEGNAITVPPWALHRDPRYFSPHPDSFIPERWLADDGSRKYVTSRDAFIPFSSGPQNCVGRPLAQMEMRYVLATLMWNFDMEFDTPTYDPSSWERDMEDRFTLLKGPLQVRITQTGKRGGPII